MSVLLDKEIFDNGEIEILIQEQFEKNSRDKLSSYVEIPLSCVQIPSKYIVLANNLDENLNFRGILLDKEMAKRKITNIKNKYQSGFLYLIIPDEYLVECLENLELHKKELGYYILNVTTYKV